jgi:hypothetical protein
MVKNSETGSQTIMAKTAENMGTQKNRMDSQSETTNA